MYFNLKNFLAIVVVCLMIFVCIIMTSFESQRKEIEKLEEQINTFILAEGQTHGKIKMVRAWYYSTLDNGNTLLETEDGELHEFENIEVTESDLFLMVFDGDEFVGLWKAA